MLHDQVRRGGAQRARIAVERGARHHGRAVGLAPHDAHLQRVAAEGVVARRGDVARAGKAQMCIRDRYTLPSTPMRRLMLYEIMPQVCDAA